jgi:predicted nucleic acid-binding protein
VIVVDTNVVAYFFIEGEQTEFARSLWRSDPVWRLPPLWRHEYLNVLATFVRHGGADREAARTLWTKAIRMLAGSELDVDMAAALELAVTHTISAYDAQFVALAQALKVKLATNDQQLLRSFPSLAMPLANM